MRCLQCCTVYCSLPAFWSMPSFPAAARLVLPQTRRCGEFSGCVVQAKEAERETGWRVLHWLLLIFLTVPAFSLSLTEPYCISHCMAAIVPALSVTSLQNVGLETESVLWAPRQVFSVHICLSAVSVCDRFCHCDSVTTWKIHLLNLVLLRDRGGLQSTCDDGVLIKKVVVSIECSCNNAVMQ